MSNFTINQWGNRSPSFSEGKDFKVYFVWKSYTNFDKSHVRILLFLKAEIIVQADEQNGRVTEEIETRFQTQRQALTNNKSCHLIIVSEACRNERVSIFERNINSLTLITLEYW